MYQPSKKNKQQNAIHFNSINMPLSISSEKEVLSNRQQPPSCNMLLLIHREKVGE
jgi:hypothetical protein